MAYTINHYITDWVEESRALMQPDKVLWIDGTETQLEELRREAYITGELIKLNQEKLPGCVYHRSALNDVARVEGRTFICCKKEEDAGPTNNRTRSLPSCGPSMSTRTAASSSSTGPTRDSSTS